MTGRAAVAAAAMAAALCIAAPPAGAHAFGQRYDLPLPLWLYTTGAGATVGLSFAVIALFLRPGVGDRHLPSVDLLRLPALRWLGDGWVASAAEAVSVALFALVLAACFIGDPEPFDNVAPTFVWVVWWVGLAFVSALAGNLWDLVNPWRILFRWAERRLGAGRARRPYPARLGHWPAVVLFLAFAWMELISEGAEKPRTLGVLIVAYSAITWWGMARFGCETWLRHGEVFSVAFGVLARFAPLAGGGGRLRLRLPSSGLVTDRPISLSCICFVLLMLTTVTFDGILETPFWQSVLAWVSESRALRGPLVVLQRAGVDLLVLLETLALLVLPGVFAAVYLAVSRLIAAAGGGRLAVSAVAGHFVLTLVPIAIAYHLSHYLSYLLIAGQGIIPLASDPFGFGWDLFGTGSHRIDLGIVTAKTVWWVAVSAIVAGHVVAVLLAHVIALRVFPTPRRALLSQLPMLVLMVGYTMLSLWILSQPIVA